MKQYTVDAFTEKVFAGNPAAVCVMDKWLSDEIMKKIAMENNLSETAFAVKEGDLYHLRWFTPAGEVNLCGHATMATSYVILNIVEPELQQVKYTTRSGILTVTKKGKLLEMNFPVWKHSEIPVTDDMELAFGARPAYAYKSNVLLCVMEKAEDVRKCKPNQDVILNKLGGGAIITAKDEKYDFVSRVFAPIGMVPEDPVTGSAHCVLTPYWSEQLGKTEFNAYQASRRGGELHCELKGDRVFISGYATLFAESEIYF